MAHHGGSTSSSGSGWNKVLKDFILGGTSGAIAKTIAAPIERVKLLLQTQENNPRLAARPYKGTTGHMQALSTVSSVACRRKEWFRYGEATGRMYCGTSPPRPLTSLPRMPFTASSSRVLTPRSTGQGTSVCHCCRAVSLVASVSSSSILSILQGPDWAQTSVSLQLNGSSTVFLTAVRKSL